MKILVMLMSFILIAQLAQSQFIIKDGVIVGFDKFILGTNKSVFEKQLKPGEKMYQYSFLKNKEIRYSVLRLMLFACFLISMIV